MCTLKQPSLRKRACRRHIRSWQYAKEKQTCPIAKGWKCADVSAFNQLISQALPSSVTVGQAASVLNQAASYTKQYPDPHEDPLVSSLIHRANLAEGQCRQQLLADAAAIRRVKKRQKRQRQAETLSSGLWYQTQRISYPRPTPPQMSSEPGRPTHDRTTWPRMVERYCARLFGGPPKERLVISACLTLARRKAAAKRLAVAWTTGDQSRGRLSFSMYDLALPMNRAVGTDGLSTEVLLALNLPNQKALAALLEKRLNAEDDPAFCEEFWQQFGIESAPQGDESWREALAIMLPKIAKPESLLDYRSIHLVPILQKIYVKAIIDRMRTCLWASISTNQFGARPKHQAQQVIHFCASSSGESVGGW